MMNKIFSLSVMLFLVSEVHSKYILKKCCDLDHTLDIASMNISDVNSFREHCTLDQKYSIFGYNIGSTGFPDCDNLQMSSIDSSQPKFEGNGCVEFIDKQFVNVFCPAEPKLEILSFYKCCAENQSFDIDQSECVPDTQNIDKFKKIFGEKIVRLRKYQWPCGALQPLVIFSSLRHDISVDGIGLRVSLNHKRSEFLGVKQFCIDGVSGGSSVDQTEVIVQGCTSMSVCDEIPCVPRCCQTSQVLDPSYNCVANPQKPKTPPVFYDVRNFFFDENDVPRNISVRGL